MLAENMRRAAIDPAQGHVNGQLSGVMVAGIFVLIGVFAALCALGRCCCCHRVRVPAATPKPRLHVSFPVATAPFLPAIRRPQNAFTVVVGHHGFTRFAATRPRSSDTAAFIGGGSNSSLGSAHLPPCYAEVFDHVAIPSRDAAQRQFYRLEDVGEAV